MWQNCLILVEIGLDEGIQFLINGHADVIVPLDSLIFVLLNLLLLLEHVVSVPSLDMGTMCLLGVPVKSVHGISNILPALLLKVTTVQIH